MAVTHEREIAVGRSAMCNKSGPAVWDAGGGGKSDSCGEANPLKL
ncbi:MAG: hypothetical protein AAFZ80_11335 [Cyanobacteria bacterium P01_A01_bin.105]